MAEDTNEAPVPRRNLLIEIIGIVLSMAAGAFVGLQAGGNGLGFLGFIVLCSLMGCVGWVRRRQSFIGTIGIWVVMLLVGWPVCGVLRMLGQELAP
jgi:hypothetical protein